MRERTLVKDLAAREDGPVVLGGWVEKLRDQKRIQFIILRDESGDVQVTYPRPVVDEQPVEDDALAAKVSTLTSGSFVWITGRLVHDERVKLGGLEVQLDDLDIDYENSIVLVEWGKGMTDDLVESWLEIIIERERAVEHAADDSDAADPRKISIHGFGPRWANVSLGEVGR